MRAHCLNLTDLLRLNPSVKIPYVRVLELLPPLVARFYSICTSPLAMPNRVQIAHNIIPNGLPETAMKELPGLCTNWMDSLCNRMRAALNVTEQRNAWVRLPPQTPVSGLTQSLSGTTLSFPSRPQSARARAHAWCVGPLPPKEDKPVTRVERPPPRPVLKTQPAPAINPGITITMTESDGPATLHPPALLSEGRPGAGHVPSQPPPFLGSPAPTPATDSATNTNGHTALGSNSPSTDSNTPGHTHEAPIAQPRLPGPPDPFNILIPVQRRQVNIFRVPSEPTVPVIMVGPGTGVSPFVGFLQHRSYMEEREKGERVS